MNVVVLAFLKKWWPVIGAAILMGSLLTLAYCKGESAGKNGEIINQQEREIETQKDLNSANENAAATRLEDAARAAQQEKELTDVVQSTVDPDARRRLRGCIILRQQGRDLEDIPACRGLVAGD